MNTEDTKKKETVRISKKDLLKLLADNEHLQKQVTELQTRGTELVTENRDLRKQLADRPVIMVPPEECHDDFPMYDPEVYIDGASKFRT